MQVSHSQRGTAARGEAALRDGRTPGKSGPSGWEVEAAEEVSELIRPLWASTAVVSSCGRGAGLAAWRGLHEALSWP